MRPLLCAIVLLGALRAATIVASAGDRLDADVIRVDDGDTVDVRLGDRIERVRYIGIDAPEVPHDGRGGTPGGLSATEINRTLVANRRVTLELDVERRDRYGRLLAYVWVDGVMANLEMVRRGYARALTIPPNVRHSRSFVMAERSARIERRGLWPTGALRRRPARPVSSVAGPKP
jgi:micrococcal nuclease